MRAGGCGAVDGLVHGQVLAGAGGVHVVAVEREVRVEIRQLTLRPVAVALQQNFDCVAMQHVRVRLASVQAVRLQGHLIR